MVTVEQKRLLRDAIVEMRHGYIAMDSDRMFRALVAARSWMPAFMAETGLETKYLVHAMNVSIGLGSFDAQFIRTAQYYAQHQSPDFLLGDPFAHLGRAVQEFGDVFDKGEDFDAIGIASGRVVVVMMRCRDELGLPEMPKVERDLATEVRFRDDFYRYLAMQSAVLASPESRGGIEA